MTNSISDKNFTEKFKIAYKNLYDLHPPATEEDFRFRYLKVDWFFPNHLHNVLYQIKKLSSHFEKIDLSISFYGGLLHDAGLVYKRESADATGHENRSVEYAKNELSQLGYDQNYIEKVLECIKATEPDYESTLSEALLVRNADAYAHMISMHFFAKANFSKDIHSFIKWFEDKARSTYSKITISELQQEVKPIVEFYERMIKNYKDNKDEKDFLSKIIL